MAAIKVDNVWIGVGIANPNTSIEYHTLPINSGPAAPYPPRNAHPMMSTTRLKKVTTLRFDDK